MNFLAGEWTHQPRRYDEKKKCHMNKRTSDSEVGKRKLRASEWIHPTGTKKNPKCFEKRKREKNGRK